MKKIIKGLLYFFGGIVALVLIAGIVIPIFFKDDIKAAVDKQLEETVNAKIVYDLDKFGVTIFKDFPNISVEIQDFGVINNAPFKGDTLAMVGEFGVTLDIMSVFKGEQMQINRVYIDRLVANVQVNKEGAANYDIVISDEETVEEEVEESEPFAINLEYWEITNGRIVYDDQTIPTTVTLNDFNHSGSGAIADVYDLNLKTSVGDLNVAFDGDTYYKKSKFDSDITLNLDLTNGKYTFKENVLKLNEFAFGFDGFVSMPTDDIEMAITFEAKETAFKNVLSIVPGMFMEGFEDIKTDGSLGFNGEVKGVYNETTMPGFFLNLLVKDAMFQYPDLPAAVKNIELDLEIDNKDADMDNIAIALKKFHMDLGSNPIDVNMVMNVLKSEDFDIKDANVSAKINLEEVTSFYPVDGMKLKGLFGMDIHAVGMYSEKQELTPDVFGKMKLDDGWVHSEEFNVTAEEMTCSAWVKYNQRLTANDTILKVDHFGLTLDDERFESQLAVWDLDDISWDFMIKGLIDLEKMMKLAPMEGTTLKGKIAVDEFRSIGKLSDVDAGNYDNLETHGTVTITDFVYFEEELLPQGLKITKSELTLDPKNLKLRSFDGFIGKSDMKMDGEITNYMGYTKDLMKDTITPSGTLGGRLNYSSKVFYTDEWLDTTEVAELAEVENTGDVPAGNYEDNAVPKNIHFIMDASIDKILYDNMEITEAKGELVIKEGVVDMSGLKMTILGGHFVMDGEYNTFNPLKPSFDFNMNIDRLSFKKSYETFNSVKKMAPIAENIVGTFSTDFKVSGLLDADLMPVYEKLNGFGDFLIANAKLKDLALLEKITEATKMYKTDKLSVENTKIKAVIKDGKVIFEPFTTSSGESDITIGGSRSLDGVLDLDVKLDVPAGKAGDAMNNALAKYGVEGAVGERVVIPLKVTGDESNPKIKIIGGNSSAGSSVKNIAKEKAKEEINKAKEEMNKELEKRKEEQKKKILADAKKQADKLRAEGVYQGKKVKDEANYQAKELEEKASKPWEKATAKVAADKVRKEGVKQEKEIIKSANKQADQLLIDAQKRADAI